MTNAPEMAKVGNFTKPELARLDSYTREWSGMSLNFNPGIGYFLLDQKKISIDDIPNIYRQDVPKPYMTPEELSLFKNKSAEYWRLLNKMPSRSEGYTYREISIGNESIDQFLSKYKIDSEVVIGTFQSSSKNEIRAKNRLRSDQRSTKIIYKVKSKFGKDISGLSLIKQEEEVILLPGKYKVIANNKKKHNGIDYLEIELEQVELISPDLSPNIQNDINKELIYGHGEFTDPQNFDPENYTLMVHAFNPYVSETQKAVNPSFKEEYVTKNIQLHPDKINEKGFISTSVINAEHNGTFANSGVILNPPDKASVILSSPSDMGTPHLSNPDLNLSDFNNRQDYLPWRKKYSKILNPTELIESTNTETGFSSYNEVLLYSHSKSEAYTPPVVSISGVFVKVNHLNTDIHTCSDQTFEKLQELSKELNVPLVKIPIKNKTQNLVELKYQEKDFSWSSNDTPETEVIHQGQLKKTRQCTLIMEIEGYRYTYKWFPEIKNATWSFLVDPASTKKLDALKDKTHLEKINKKVKVLQSNTSFNSNIGVPCSNALKDISQYAIAPSF